MRFIHDLSYDTTRMLYKMYQKSTYHRVRQRAQCILLSHQGYTTNELSHIFQVHRITIYNWLNAWESQHLARLYDKKGKGRHPSLQPKQKEQIRQWAKQFPKNLNRVGALIAEEFGRKVSKKTIKRVLKTVHYSWRRIRRKPPNHPEPHSYHTRREALEVLRTEAADGIIDLRYVDESGFCLVPYIPYAWQEKGETIAIESMPSKRINVVGFLNTRNELEAYSVEGSVTSEVMIQCIDDFCTHIQEPTVLVMDNASIHTSKAFQNKIPEWEAQSVDIFYLPTYAPELNLIEILWRLMKYVWIEFWAYTSWEHLVAYVEGVIRDFGEKYKINFV